MNPSRIVDVAMKLLLVLGSALTVLVGLTQGWATGLLFLATYGGGVVVAYLCTVIGLWSYQSLTTPSQPVVEEVDAE